MGITIKCKKCGCTDGYLRVGDVHTGLHCKQCNSWIKWVSKHEISILESGETIINEVDTIDELDIKALEKQRDELNKQIHEYYNEQTKRDIANNAGYIGKTFKKLISKETMGYYKILDVEENNQYRMKTLVFCLPVKPFMSKNSYEETSLLDIESIGWFCNSMSSFGLPKREIELYTEISTEEYLEAFNNWLEKIKEITDKV